MRWAIFMMFVCALSVSSPGRSVAADYFGISYDPDGLSYVIARVEGGNITATQETKNAPKTGTSVSVFSIERLFDGKYRLGKREWIDEVGQDVYCFDDLKGFVFPADYGFQVFCWTGNRNAIKQPQPLADRETYAKFGAEFLASTAPAEHFDCTADNVYSIWKVDMDGNGQDEVVYGIASGNVRGEDKGLNVPYPGECQTYLDAPGYSSLILRYIGSEGNLKSDQLYFLDYESTTQATDDPDSQGWMPEYYQLAGIIDLDGDGTYELVTKSAYYEGEGYDIWKYSPSGVEKVASFAYGL